MVLVVQSEPFGSDVRESGRDLRMVLESVPGDVLMCMKEHDEGIHTELKYPSVLMKPEAWDIPAGHVRRNPRQIRFTHQH